MKRIWYECGRPDGESVRRISSEYGLMYIMRMLDVSIHWVTGDVGVAVRPCQKGYKRFQNRPNDGLSIGGEVALCIHALFVIMDDRPAL